MIIESNNKQFPPHPEGVFEAVLVDVIDQGVREKDYKGEKKMVREVRFVYETESLRDDGKRRLLSGWYTAALNEKANLRKVVETILGRVLTKEEETRFDVSSLKGKALKLIVENSLKSGKPRITKTMRATNPLTPSGEYVRKERNESPDWSPE